MPQAFVLLTDSKIEPSAKKGMTVYSCVKHDYGSANDDTRMTGIHHVSLTLDATGDYPFFTHAFKDLEKVEAEPCAHSEANRLGRPECGEQFKAKPRPIRFADLPKTTNQTIDGVPRGLLGNIAVYLADSHSAIMRARAKELRALLDAPFESQYDGITPAQAQMVSQGIDELIGGKPAAQPQGEPVAWQYMTHPTWDKGPWPTEWTDCTKEAHDDYARAPMVADWEYRTRKLYAEQPAPVAVVMPEREAMRDIIAKAIGGDTYDCVRVWSAWGVGTMSEDDFVPVVDQEDRLYEIADAFLDEVNRLNTKSR